MDITDEVQLVGPGHRRRASHIRMGYWTPELAKWSDAKGYVKNEVLVYTTYDDTGTRVYGGEVNASPVICIVKNQIGHEELTVQVTGNQGTLDNSIYVEFSGAYISGFTSDNQYGQKVYRRKWITGGSEFTYEFTIPPYTEEGQIFDIPSKHIYEITDVNVTPRSEDQPMTDISFYAMADNGSRLLYSMNWNKVFDSARTVLYGMYGQPTLCPRCDGTGYFTSESDTCDQCDGYRFHGPNASGFLLDQIGLDEKIIRDEDDDNETFRNKIWAMKWWINPTKNETRRYLAHFARIQDDEVEIVENDRVAGATGVERVVDVYLPYTMPEAVISRSDAIWTRMAKRCEPAGILVRFSFLSEAFTGARPWEELSSMYQSGYISGVLTGYIHDSGQWGFYDGFEHEFGSYGWGNPWGDDWFFYNYLSGATGGDDCSGYAHISGSPDTYIEGRLAGDEWMRWAWPSGGNVDDALWHTGLITDDIDGVDQAALWSNGTFYLDNFWGSGTLEDIKY